jgi:hypothetical protein
MRCPFTLFVDLDTDHRNDIYYQMQLIIIYYKSTRTHQSRRGIPNPEPRTTIDPYPPNRPQHTNPQTPRNDLAAQTNPASIPKPLEQAGPLAPWMAPGSLHTDVRFLAVPRIQGRVG